MNIQQRISQLEQLSIVTGDPRQGLLVEFIGSDDTDQDATAGILYTYGNSPSTQRLNRKSLLKLKGRGL